MSEEQPFEVFGTLEVETSTLVVGWSEDAGSLGATVADYLNRKLASRELAEMRLEGFFPLAGVAVAGDVAQFPESKFYSSPSGRLVTFKSDAATGEWYQFLNGVLDVAERYCHAKELFTIGGMVTASAHTAPRDLFAVANLPEMKSALIPYDVVKGVDYETPRGQRPTLSTYLLWLASRRHMPAASLWVPVSFYLASVQDLHGCAKTVEFLERRLNLGLDTSDLREEAARQDERIEQGRSRSPELDGYIRKVESGQALAQEDGEKLTRLIAELLQGTG